MLAPVVIWLAAGALVAPGQALLVAPLPVAPGAGRLAMHGAQLRPSAFPAGAVLRMSTSTLERIGAPWDADETARFRETVVKAARANKLRKAECQVEDALRAAQPLCETRAALSPQHKVDEQEEASAELIWRRLPGYDGWLAFVKRATRKGYDENGKARPRAPGFKGAAIPEVDEGEQKLSAFGKWQRTDGPYYVQFAGATVLLLGFLNHMALKNHNGSGIEDLSQACFAFGIIIVMLGFAVERKSPAD